MEVHHHAHTERNKWTHYFWEFLMLFLAVFAGFLAENLREQKAEQHHAKELAISFYSELKNDSIAIQNIQQNRLKRDSSFTYLKGYFRDSSINSSSKTFAIHFNYAFVVFATNLFEPNDAILHQLINSGTLRYFKSTEIQKLTGDLSVAIANVRTRNQFESNFLDMYILPYLIKHNDLEFFDQVNNRYKELLVYALAKYEHSNEIIPFHFNKPDVFDKTESLNLTGSYQQRCLGTSIKQYAAYQELNAKLLEKLRGEYDLK